MKPQLKCCTPIFVPVVGRWSWCHSKFCPTSQRLQKVREDINISRDEALSRLAHPAGRVGMSAVLTFHSHPSDCLCDEGCGYTDFHLDDNDDRTLEGLRR